MLSTLSCAYFALFIEMLFEHFPIFYLGCLFITNCKGYLYILDSISLLDILFADIVSHSVGWIS